MCSVVRRPVFPSIAPGATANQSLPKPSQNRLDLQVAHVAQNPRRALSGDLYHPRPSSRVTRSLLRSISVADQEWPDVVRHRVQSHATAGSSFPSSSNVASPQRQDPDFMYASRVSRLVAQRPGSPAPQPRMDSTTCTIRCETGNYRPAVRRTSECLIFKGSLWPPVRLIWKHRGAPKRSSSLPGDFHCVAWTNHRLTQCPNVAAQLFATGAATRTVTMSDS